MNSMRFIFLLGVIGLWGPCFGQNLVLDPDFSIIRSCGSRNHLTFFPHWYSPNASQRNRPYHPCLNNIPINNIDLENERYPKSGDGMMSIEIFYTNDIENRSYIATSLSSSLKPNTPYLVRFYAKPVMDQDVLFHSVANSIGMHLTRGEVYQDDRLRLPFIPQVEWYGPYLEDFDYWYPIQGKYMAEGGENTIIIGNFRPGESVEWKYTNPSAGGWPNLIQVYIDDVTVEAFDPLPDTLLVCGDTPVDLDAGFHDAFYQWSTGEKSSRITVRRSGKYKVTATIDTLVFEDSTSVFFAEDFVSNTSVDTFVCKNSLLSLRGPLPGDYKWSTGLETAVFPVSGEGLYGLEIKNECGTFQIDFQVEERDCDCDLTFPSAFSPNGDSWNDHFTVIDQCPYSDWSLISFQVYDKWGGIVYHEMKNQIRWNGQDTQGKNLPAGAYLYHMQAHVNNGRQQQEITKTGTVQLLR